MRRGLILVVFYLLLGAVLACVVAIACAYLGGDGKYEVEFEAERIATRWQSHFGDAEHYDEFLYADRVRGLGWDFVRMGAVDHRSGKGHLRGRLLAGWPAEALRGEYRVDDGKATLIDAVDTGRTIGSGPAERTQLVPLRPIWGGLLIDAVFFGAFLHIGFYAAAKTRARWQRRRGRCPRCGYDLRGGVERCPECGGE